MKLFIFSLFFLFLFQSFAEVPEPRIDGYCHQLGGKVLGKKEVTYEELSFQKCFELVCQTSQPLAKLRGKEGEDIQYVRVDEDQVTFKVCQDKSFGALKQDVKIHFSYLDFEHSEGAIQTFFVRATESCWKECRPDHKDSTEYDCKHCIRKHYFPNITDIEFTLMSYMQAPYCIANYDHDECKLERTPASAGAPFYIIEDLVEEMWCDIVEKSKSVKCKGIDYTKTQDEFQKYFINVPLRPAPEFAFMDDEEMKKTDIKVICLNTGKTPFDLNYKYVSCSDGLVYEKFSAEALGNKDKEGLDELRSPAGKLNK